jgi:hypothetical protein
MFKKTRCCSAFGGGKRRGGPRIVNFEVDSEVNGCEATWSGNFGVLACEIGEAPGRRRPQKAQEFVALSGAECLTAWPFLPTTGVQSRAWFDAASLFPALLPLFYHACFVTDVLSQMVYHPIFISIVERFARTRFPLQQRGHLQFSRASSHLCGRSLRRHVWRAAD